MVCRVAPTPVAKELCWAIDAGDQIQMGFGAAGNSAEITTYEYNRMRCILLNQA